MSAATSLEQWDGEGKASGEEKKEKRERNEQKRDVDRVVGLSEFALLSRGSAGV